MLPALFSIASSPLQPLDPLSPVARCPRSFSAARPSVLYNHVSKTGGTDVKGMLTRALGASGAPSAPVSLIHLGAGGSCRPIKANSNQIGSEGALIIEDDRCLELAVNNSALHLVWEVDFEPALR